MRTVIILIIFVLTITTLIVVSVKKSLEYYAHQNSLNFIDSIVFINLEDRKDRLEHIKKTLWSINPSKIHRFNAIYDKHGHIGCSKSHIGCLELAMENNWKNVLILEDDFTWNNYDETIKIFKKIYETNPDFDVISLGNVGSQFDKNTYRLYSGQTATCYLVNRHYYKALRDVFEEGLINMERDPNSHNLNAVDQIWKKLQKKDKWYIVNPALGIQKSSHSSICNQQVDYKSMFNI